MSRRALLTGIALAGAVSAAVLGLSPSGLTLGGDRLALLGRFFAAALSPAWISPSDLATPVLPRTLEGVHNTVVFAVAAIGLALGAGSVMGLLASRRWWDIFPRLGPLRPALFVGARAGIALLRSIHEILWALALLAAFGLNTAAAVLAIAIPYSGTIAKVFSEMLDEAPDAAAEALRQGGAGPLQVFCFGLLPAALPDLGAYAFYRFECALRSAAVLGFFGFPTLGKFIHESFGELYFEETWTHLYALFALIVLVEAWSGRLRRRWTAA